MRILFLDCPSGISGDMAVAALCDLGVDSESLMTELSKLGLVGEYDAHFSRQDRCGVSCLKFDVHLHDHGHSHHHGHHHDHEHHVHGRTFATIRALIANSSLSEFVRNRSIAVFRRIAEAEGRIHGMPAEDVHFHEVGAVDSIVDIVAACICLERLNVDKVVSSPLVEGTGTVECAHGRFPIPAPATLEILAGVPLRQTDTPGEHITPTGAALIAEFCETFGPMPSLRIGRIGYGAGTRNPSHAPNMLRAVLGDSDDVSGSDTVTEIDANIDDMSPEILAVTAESLLTAGALDVFVTPIQMKKGRPAFRLTVLAQPQRADEFATRLLRETSTFGVRMHECRRKTLRRDTIEVDTRFGSIVVKRGWLGDELVHRAPEFESCRKAAEAAGIPVGLVYDAAVAAFER